MSDSGEDPFDEDVTEARKLLERDDLDALYVGVVHDEELDYRFAHRLDEREEIGRRALALLAKHIQAISDQAEIPVEQVASDAAQFAKQFE